MTTDIDFDLEPAWLDKFDEDGRTIVVMDEAGLKALPAGARFLDSTDEVMTKLDEFTFQGADDGAFYGIGELAREYLPGAVLDGEVSYARVGDTVEVTYAPLNRSVECEIGTVTAINTLAPVLGYSLPFTVRLEDGEQYLVGAVYVIWPAVDDEQDEAIGLATFEGVSADLSWTDEIADGFYEEPLAEWERELLREPVALRATDLAVGDRVLLTENYGCDLKAGELCTVTAIHAVSYASPGGAVSVRPDGREQDYYAFAYRFESVDEDEESVRVESFDLYLDTPPYVGDVAAMDALPVGTILVAIEDYLAPRIKHYGKWLHGQNTGVDLTRLGVQGEGYLAVYVPEDDDF